MQNFLNALRVASKGCGSGLIMLHELYIAEKINASPVERLAIEYLFHNAQHVYTPIWSLVAQERGSKVSLYFYSTNCEFLRLKFYKKINIFGYESMIWKNYYVWDEYQKNFINSITNCDKVIEIVGPIFFSDGVDYKFKNINKKKIAIFGYSPQSIYNYALNCEIARYHTSQYAIRFIQNILDSLSSNDVLILFKEKRDLGENSCKKYASYLNSLEKKEGLKIIDSSISAFTIIEDADLVISWPYTSTGVIAKNLNKPSAFYDVAGRLANDEEISHGVEFLGDKNKLQNWLSEKLTKEQNHHQNL